MNEAGDNTSGLEIAVIGMGCRFPDARSVDEYWHNLKGGVESITFFSDEELKANGVQPELLAQPHFVKAGVVLEGADQFDPALFDITPREAEVLDPQHRVFLECAWEALENAGYDSEKFSGPIGVYAGARTNTYLANIQSNPEVMASVGDYQANLANNLAYVPTRVSYKLGLRGPSLSIQTACSTSLVAIHMACQGLLSAECDIALAGGVAVYANQKKGYLHQTGMIFSPDGHCRPFDEKARGTIWGNGAGIVVLKRLEEAVESGDTIHAVIKGTAINNDGDLKVGFTAPSVDGQARVIRAAQTMAEVDADTISYVETHGTATELGDPIEITALTKAFHSSSQRNGFCAIGSVKSNIGHLSAAAGVAGLIKTVLALKHGKLPPSLHFEKPNPKIDFENSPFFVNTELRDWAQTVTPRRAGVSSFGIGGTNAHAILEEAPIASESGASRPWQLLFLSAKTPSALDRISTNMRNHLSEQPDISFPDVAFTLQLGRKDLPQRRVLVCQNPEDAIGLLQQPEPQRVLTAKSEPKERPLIFMFPGQGNQYVNMGLELYRTEQVFKQYFDACADLLTPILGLDVRNLVFPEPGCEQEAGRQLKSTSITQPVLFSLEYSLAMLLRDWGYEVRAMAGHSIGEYVAACQAGVFSLEDGLALVAARGRLMQSCPAGDMIAVLLPEKRVLDLIDQDLSVAAVNSPALTVVSGPEESIEQFQCRLQKEECPARLIHTSHAFHSKMMDPILDEFKQEVSKLSLMPPQIPFTSNLTGTWITETQATSPQYWADHLRSTVRFSENVKAIAETEPEGVFVEVGPGTTLGSLVRQHRQLPKELNVCSSMRHAKDTQPDLQVLLTMIGELWLLGISADWHSFYSLENRHRIPLPTYPFERKRYWINHRVPISANPQTDQLPVDQDVHDLIDQPCGANTNPESALPTDITTSSTCTKQLNRQGSASDALQLGIANIWQELLGIDNIELHDNFFDLGGHSLLGTLLINRLQNDFKIDIQLQLLFENPTIGDLAREIENQVKQNE